MASSYDRRPSISQIAKEVGFTKTTVSLALRDHPRISEETKRKVEAVAKAQGYTRDPHLTRAFSIIRKGRSPTHNVIGYLDTSKRSKNLGSVFADQVRRNLIESAQSKGFSVTVFTVDEKEMPLRRLKQIIESRNIRHLLVPAPALIDDLPLDWENLTTIVLSTRPLKRPFNRVTTSNYQAVSLLMNKIKEKGYRKPGFMIRKAIDELQDSECAIAFHGLCERLNFRERVPILYTDGETTISDYERWYRDNRPDVIIQNSHTGIVNGSLHSYTEILQQFESPIDPGVGRCSLNANPETESISGVIRNEQEIGYSAIDLMLSMIERNVMGVPDNPKALTILSDWTEGVTLPEKQAGGA